MHKFRFDALSSAKPKDIVSLGSGENAHLFKTLRANPGDECELIDGHGRTASAIVVSGRRLQIIEITETPRPQKRIHLYIAPPRRQKMDQILKQAVELGVWRIVPMVCERSVSLPGEDSISGRWEDLLFEACKQSGNPFLPRVANPMKFAAAVCDSKAVCGKMFYGSPRIASGSEETEDFSDIGFFVGAEGGFSPDEETLMKNSFFIPLMIGKWTLRVETAAVCGIAVLLKQ